MLQKHGNLAICYLVGQQRIHATINRIYISIMKSQGIFPAFYKQLIPFFQFLIHRQFNEKFMYVSSLLIFICAKKKCAKKNCIPFYTVKIFKCRKRKFHMQFLCTFSLTVCHALIRVHPNNGWHIQRLPKCLNIRVGVN